MFFYVANVEAKSTESTARPALLALRNLAGSVVTIAALGGQGEIARQSIAQGGEYVLSVQENQPRL